MVFVSKKYCYYFWENETKTFHVNVLLQSGANVEFADQIRHMHEQTSRKHCLIIDPAAKKVQQHILWKISFIKILGETIWTKNVYYPEVALPRYSLRKLFWKILMVKFSKQRSKYSVNGERTKWSA